MPPALVEAGGNACANGKEVAQKADIIITMVPDTPHVEAVLFGDNGVAAGLTQGQDRRRHELDLAARDQGVREEDQRARLRLPRRAGVGRRGRRQGRVADDHGAAAREAAFDKVKPLFELMGKNITLVGGNGDGQTTKVANQIIVALNIEAVGEALLFASKAGADPAKVRQALMGGFASSRILEVHGERMIKRTFDPGFRIELHQKDLNLALSTGARSSACRCPTPPRPGAVQRLRGATAARRWDHSAWCKALEMLANFEIGQKARELIGASILRIRPQRCCAACSTRRSPPRSRRVACRRTCPTPPQGPHHRHRRRQGVGGDGEGVRGRTGPASASGLVVTRYGYAVPCRKIEIVEAAHPVPDAAGLAAAKRILDLVSRPRAGRSGASR